MSNYINHFSKCLLLFPIVASGYIILYYFGKPFLGFGPVSLFGN